MIDVKINQAAYQRMQNTLIMLINRIKDMRPIWKDFALWYPGEVVAKAFDSRGKEFGTRWEKFNEKYLKWKQKNYSGAPMLVQSGNLKRAALNPTAKYDNFNLKLTVENDLANIHQFGAKLKNGKIPARPFFAMPDKTVPKRAVKYLIEKMRDYIMAGKK